MLAGWALWRRLEWAIPAAWVGAFFFPLAYWLEQFILVRSLIDWVNWPFMLGLSLLWLLLVILTLTLRSNRAYLAKEKTIDE